MPNANKIKRFALTLLGLVPTPLILFISTSLQLYLRNQNELDQQLGVLLPFVILFTTVLTFGVVLCALSKYRFFKYLLWIYHLAGPTFLVVSLLRGMLPELFGSPEGIALTATVLALAALILATKLNPTVLLKPFAFLGIFLIVLEVSQFAAAYTYTSFHQAIEGISQPPSTKEHPNIYHIVMDSYQTDIFETTLSPKVEKGLGGFVYFPKNTSLFKNTGMSFPSIFLGKSYDYNTPMANYQKSAFNSKHSFLYWLKKAGYTTRAHLQKIYSFKLALFDNVIEHKDNVGEQKVAIDHTSTFVSLWLSTNTPKAVAEELAPNEDTLNIAEQNFLPKTWPLMSYISFQNFMEEEKRLPGSGRYEFLHLIIPHPPGVFRADCSYSLDNGEVAQAPILEQAKCATKLIIDFANLLKKLKRFDNSLIIVQADHGGGVRVENERLIQIKYGPENTERAWVNSRALLLIKPIGRTRDNEFQISQAETILPDTAPTVLKSLGIETGLKFTGVSLVDPILWDLERRRYFHLYSKKNKPTSINEWTDEMHRFVIEDDQIRFDKTIKLLNNPPIQRKK